MIHVGIIDSCFSQESLRFAPQKLFAELWLLFLYFLRIKMLICQLDIAQLILVESVHDLSYMAASLRTFILNLILKHAVIWFRIIDIHTFAKELEVVTGICQVRNHQLSRFSLTRTAYSWYNDFLVHRVCLHGTESLLCHFEQVRIRLATLAQKSAFLAVFLIHFCHLCREKLFALAKRIKWDEYSRANLRVKLVLSVQVPAADCV